MSTVVGIIMEAERTSFLEEVLRRERFVDADRGPSLRGAGKIQVDLEYGGSISSRLLIGESLAS
jgi:hypothetical protein